MLKIRIIPTLLWKTFGLVKGVGFDSWRRVGPVLPAVKVYNQREVDELILLDIAATLEGRDPDYEGIQEISSDCFVPLTVGGGITNLYQAQNLLRAGADKICLNTITYSKPDLITKISEKHGNQCVIVSVDVRKIDNIYECFSHNGKIRTGKNVVEWVQELEKKGAGELILTSIDLDGTMKGYDFDLLKTVAKIVRIPVIASGGAGDYSHMIKAIQECGASAVAAASMFHFTEQTPYEAKTELKKSGIPVREKIK